MSQRSTPAAISVENLTHVYRRGTSLEKKALEDISLKIEAGECIGIVGRNGSGKTTLIQHFNGLLKPSAGRVCLEGMDLADSPLPVTALRRRVGLLFQYPEHQLFEETVFRDISFVLRQNPDHSFREIKERVKAACTGVGLDYEAFQFRSPFELSTGEMRRVALAGILAQEPLILVLDEPTLGLDGEGQREILARIAQLNRSGKTVVIVSHLVEDLLPLVHRFIVLEKGRLLAAGSPSRVFSFLLAEEKQTFLVPPVFRLCWSLRKAGWEIPENVMHAEEALPVLDRLLRERKNARKTP